MAEPEAASAHDLAERVCALALALGFDRAGIARLDAPLPHGDALRDWLARGRHGAMAWMARDPEHRIDPRLRFTWALTAIVVSLVYDTERRPLPSAPPTARVARYAGGRDYHDVLLPALRALGDALEALVGRAVRSRAYVDTGPLLERALAARAGLGWIGRNTCLIDPELGSYTFLGVLLTDLDLPGGEPEPDHCGTCRACLDACPTGAFPEPYVLDATRCLSYATIELRDAIPEPLRAGQGSWVFGCDVCQDVCPWNTRTRRTVPPDRAGLRAALLPRPEWVRPALAWLLGLDEDAWRAATRRTALRRAKHRGLLRNALVAAGNAGDASLVPLVARHAESPDPLIAEHARWALGRLASGRPGAVDRAAPR
ncbi:MAG TPA: tRNA epoxyqueuosine(34) reductase QueG [Myxococcota bacterium]